MTKRNELVHLQRNLRRIQTEFKSPAWEETLPKIFSELMFMHHEVQRSIPMIFRQLEAMKRISHRGANDRRTRARTVQELSACLRALRTHRAMESAMFTELCEAEDALSHTLGEIRDRTFRNATGK